MQDSGAIATIDTSSLVCVVATSSIGHTVPIVCTTINNLCYLYGDSLVNCQVESNSSVALCDGVYICTALCKCLILEYICPTTADGLVDCAIATLYEGQIECNEAVTTMAILQGHRI